MSCFRLFFTSFSILICVTSQSVFAACVNTGGSNYECSGTETTYQAITGSNLSITAGSDFHVDTANTNPALRFTSTGGIARFIDHADTVIRGTAGIQFHGNPGTTIGFDITLNGTTEGTTAIGVSTTNYGTGGTDITINGMVSGYSNGLWLNTEATSSFLSLYTAQDSMVSSETGEAVHMIYRGSGAASAIIDGEVVSNNSTGVYLFGNSTASDSNMIFEGNGRIEGVSGVVITNAAATSFTGSTGVDSVITATGVNGAGIIFNQSANRDSTLVTNGEIISARDGVRLTQGGTGILYFTANNLITAQNVGILMDSASGVGDVSVEIGENATVTGNTGSAVSLSRATGSGALIMHLDGNIKSNATSSSVSSVSGRHSGSGELIADINGMITSSGSAHALSFSRGGTGSAYITVDGEVTAEGSGYGIQMRNIGSGNSEVNVNGTVTSASSYAIQYDSNIAGTDNRLVTGNDAVIASQTANAISVLGAGNIELDLGGSITTQGNQNAIYAQSYSAGSTIYSRLRGIVTGGTAGQFIYSNGDIIEAIIDKDAHITANNGSAVIIQHQDANMARLTMDVSGHLIGSQYGLQILRNGNQRGSITLDGIIEGQSGTAISFSGATITDFDILGGRIIGDFLDNNTGNGYSLVTVKGNFESEGNFTVSDFDVANDGHFKIGENNIVNSVGTTDVYGVFETAGTNARNMRDMHVHDGGHLRVADTHRFYNGSSFTNEGVLSIGAGSVFQTDTMNAANGTLSFDIASSGSHGFLEVLNGAANLTGQTVAIDLRNAGGITEDDVFHIIHGQSAVIGGPGDVVTPVSGNSVLWDFSMVDGTQAGTDDKDIFVMAKQKAQPSQLADTTNNQRAAAVLTGLQGSTSDPELTKILSNLNSASSKKEFNAVLESVQSAIDAGDSRVAMAQMSHVQNITNLRLENLRFSGGDSALSGAGFAQNQNDQITQYGNLWATSFGENALLDDAISGQRGWGGLSGQYGHQHAKNGIAGYKSRSNGAVFGVDSGAVFDHMTIGAAFGASKMRVRSENVNRAISKADAYQVTLYGEHRLPHNSYVNASVSYALGRNETIRQNTGGVDGLTATGKFDSHQWGASTSIGHHMIFGQYIVTPSLHADWLRYNADSYTETGAGGAGLHVKSNHVDNTQGGMRLKLRREFITQEKNSIIPEIRTGYRYDFSGEQLRKNLQFTGGGASFTVDSPTPARHKFNIGGGVVYKAKTGMDFSVHYDLDIEKKYTAHSFGLRGTYRF